MPKYRAIYEIVTSKTGVASLRLSDRYNYNTEVSVFTALNYSEATAIAEARLESFRIVPKYKDMIKGEDLSRLVELVKIG